MPIIHNKGMVDLIWKGMTKPRSTDIRQWRFTIYGGGSPKTSGISGSVDTIIYDVDDYSDIENESPIDPWLWRRMDFGIANSALTLAAISEASPMIFDPKTAVWNTVDQVRIHTRVTTVATPDPAWQLFAVVDLYPKPEVLANQTLQIQDLIVRFFGGFSYASLYSLLIDGVAGQTVSQSLANTLTNGTVYWMSLHEDVTASYAEVSYTGYARQPCRLWQYAGKVYLQTSCVFPTITNSGGYANIYAVRINSNSTIGNTSVPGGTPSAVTCELTAGTQAISITQYGTPYVNHDGSAIRIV